MDKYLENEHSLARLHPIRRHRSSERLQLSSRLFQFFVHLRTKHNIDGETFLILFAFQLAYQADMAKKSLSGDLSHVHCATLSASAIAEMTRVPRETVRRKLKVLEAEGLISRGPNGAYSYEMQGEAIDIISVVEKYGIKVD